ncbi:MULTISPECIES: hypothetical protein [unclassified Bacillus (in: firmicutes)]|uniref:hypothetical protein n=1 Tax=Bacillus TaxID=1386 RepID=UPI00338FFEAD
MTQANELVSAYLSLWKNRPLNVRDMPSLQKAICEDLEDAHTHPRARKSFYEKYVISVERILQASIQRDHQLKLISLHTEKLRELLQKEGRNNL